MSNGSGVPEKKKAIRSKRTTECFLASFKKMRNVLKILKMCDNISIIGEKVGKQFGLIWFRFIIMSDSAV